MSTTQTTPLPDHMHLTRVHGITKNSDTEFVLEMTLLNFFRSHLLDRNGDRITKLENLTQTKVTFPEGPESKNIAQITGPSEAAVTDAAAKLGEQVALIADSLPCTHFVNVPLSVCPTYIERTSSFADALFEKYKTAKGMDKSIMFPPFLHHFTLFQFRVFSDEQEVEARIAFDEVQEQAKAIVGEYGLVIHARGLKSMQGNHAKSNVIYIDVEDSDGTDTLQKLAVLYRNVFLAHGISLERDRNPGGPIVLHATFINTKHRRDPTTGKMKRGVPLDATAILSEHEETDFGEWVLPVVHCSRLKNCDAFLAPIVIPPGTPARIMQVENYFKCISECVLPS
ncbi:putative activating signal cointegrator complex subunit 1 [Blattamonas nauphoetae]|uniref:Activating signal cointegrator complex subunit 1 n=1 Tax=Blattamonas nauphoetae TaxID=2049346 RepID=A0ABQ9Y9U2_9EUKA|nr:putative activating signal cointegrator complex subunit 1 [Blattamonas nauphoetae]